jgi:hypothetical protein
MSVNNVIKFHGTDNEGKAMWKEVEVILRRALERYGYGGSDVGKYAIEKTKEIFNLAKVNINFNLPAEVSPEAASEIISQVRKSYDEMVAKLAMEIVAREIEMYHLKEGKP